MTIKEVYAQIRGNFAEAKGRLMTPERIERFAKRFLNDQTYEQLEAGIMQSGDVQAAFAAAHTLKGITANLGFAMLSAAASEITEVLRADDYEQAKKIMTSVTVEYDKLIAALSALG